MNTMTATKTRTRQRTLSAIEKDMEALEIERGIVLGRKDLAEGRTIPHEMVMKMMKARLGIK